MKLTKMISELDTVIGMLIVASMSDSTVAKAKEKVIQVSIALGEFIEENEVSDEGIRIKTVSVLWRN